MATGAVNAAQAPKGVSFALPPIPQPTGLSPADASRAPNALGREWLTQQLASLPGKYNPQATGLLAETKQLMAGYGGWEWAKDNPDTAEREDLAVPQKTSSRLGTLERDAVLAERSKAAAAGVLYSSYANRAVGAALSRLNEEAKSYVSLYSKGINQLLTGFQGEVTDITKDLIGLYGEDSRWLAENPPPPVPPAAPAAPSLRTMPNIAGPIGWTGPQTVPGVGFVQKDGKVTKDIAGTELAEWPRREPDGTYVWADGKITRDPAGTVLVETQRATAPKPAANAGQPITWKVTDPKKPPYTPAQIQHRFGKGAQLTTTFVNGKKVWVVKLPGGGIARG